MRKVNLFNNPYLLFLPFLIVFIVYVLMNPTDGKFGDQPRYLLYANNLIHGFYSTPAPNIWLINGPGYPLILTPFVALKLPIISLTLLNAFFHYFSIIFLFKALKKIVSSTFTIIFSMTWACYFIAYQNIPFVHTESFTYFLISLLTYLTIRTFKRENQCHTKKQVILPGLVLGYLVLTKMIFGYVLLFMLIGYGLVWIINRNSLSNRKGFMIMVIAILTTAPYLVYTYNLTGRIFYWGMGSDSMFWMTTPYQDEYGDWNVGLNKNPPIAANYNVQGADSVLKAHHQEDFNEINKYKGIERDDAFKKLAFRNIQFYPLKYTQNIFYNMGRLLFHYPFSQALQKPRTLLILPVHGILLTLMLFSLVPTFLNWRKIPVSLKILLMITMLYLGASTLATALIRMFTIIVPILLLWIAYILENTVKINLKFIEKSKLGKDYIQLE